MNVDCDMKLYKIFPNLYGIDMEILELGLPARVFNTLKRGNINTLNELLSHTCAEILRIDGTRSQHHDGLIDHIISNLDAIGEQTLKFAAQIWRSQRPIAKKHLLLGKIISYRPDCNFPDGIKHKPIGTLHDFLCELIDWETKMLEDFRLSANGEKFALCGELDRSPDRILISEYSSYDEAKRNLCKCDWSRPGITCAVIIKTFSDSEAIYTVTINQNAEIVSIEAINSNDDGPYGLNAVYERFKHEHI